LTLLLENNLHQHVPELWETMKADDPNAWADKFSQSEIEDMRKQINFQDQTLKEGVLYLSELHDIIK